MTTAAAIDSIIDNKIKWDLYYYNICKAVGSNSRCLSRNIGAIIVKDKSIVSTGYNGPPRGIPHCGTDRIRYDYKLSEIYNKKHISAAEAKDFEQSCPRKVLGYNPGERLDMCTAVHAEVNCIINAGRLGVSILEGTMYMNSVIACRECMKVIINAGITELVVESMEFYDLQAEFLLKHSNLRVRTFRRE